MCIPVGVPVTSPGYTAHENCIQVELRVWAIFGVTTLPCRPAKRSWPRQRQIWHGSPLVLKRLQRSVFLPFGLFMGAHKSGCSLNVQYNTASSKINISIHFSMYKGCVHWHRDQTKPYMQWFFKKERKKQLKDNSKPMKAKTVICDI